VHPTWYAPVFHPFFFFAAADTHQFGALEEIGDSAGFFQRTGSTLRRFRESAHPRQIFPRISRDLRALH
jgi:hypothetical protein